MGKFQGSSESRFGSSGKDCFVVVVVVIDDDVVFFKISIWQHKLVRDYNKQESLVSYFLNNAAKTCLYGLKILKNIEIEHVFQPKGFVYFSWHPLSVSEFVCERSVHFTIPSGWRGACFFLREQIYRFSNIFIKKVSTFVRHFIIMARSLLNWKKDTNNEFNCACGASNVTKQHFEIPICFWFQLMSLSNLLFKFGKFLVWYLGCGCMTFNFTAQITLSHLLPMLINKKLECKDYQLCSKMLRKIYWKDI